MRRPLALSLLVAAALASLVLPAGAAAAQPQIGAIWTTQVNAAGATFNGEINPEGLTTTYRFEYLTDAAYQANLAAGEDSFTGAAKAPATGNPPSAGAGSESVIVARSVSALRAGTLYHFRLTASNSSGTPTSSPATFLTQEYGGGPILLDERGWELVSPSDKNGGAVQAPEGIHGGAAIQAAAGGEARVTYSSASSFGGYEATGAPPASQYISSRSAGGWSTANITTPTVSGSYGNEPNGVPYQLFSPDLASALMLNGVRCPGGGSGCPVMNPPLPGSGAPDGYQDYYLRDNGNGSFTALLTSSNAQLGLQPEEFSLALAGASPDLRHVVLSTCAALTANATEVPGVEGCDPTEPNLYEWGGGQLSLVNANPGAALAAQAAGAVSEDGSRVYFTAAGKLYLREGSAIVQVDETQGGGGEFQAATPNGALAFFTTADHLYRYDASTESATDLTPTGGVIGVLGASADGSTVYFQDASGLQQWHGGTTTTVASGPAAAQPSDYPPTTGTSRVSSDGSRLLFVSTESLTGYDNHDATTGEPDSEVYLWNAAATRLLCVTCNPTSERPQGPSTIPGAYADGQAPGSPDSYKPRALSTGQDRVFFDSEDSVVSRDTNKASDAYEWEAGGTGSCAKPGGCLALISSGTDPQGASFLDASESGADAYFLTFSSLVKADPGSADVYDARVEGGFAEPLQPIPCKGDACVPLPQGPEDPSVGSLIPGLPNPAVHFPNVHKCRKGKRTAVRHGRVVCLAKRHQKGRKHHNHPKRHARRQGSR
jgi:hypothetical protein